MAARSHVPLNESKWLCDLQKAFPSTKSCISVVYVNSVLFEKYFRRLSKFMLCVLYQIKTESQGFLPRPST